MTRILLMFVAVALCPTIPSVAQTSPILLFKLTHNVPPPIFASGPIPNSLDYRFAVVKPGVGNDPAVGLRWTTPVTANDVGNIYFATPDQVAELNTVLQSPLFVGAEIQTVTSSFSYSFYDAIRDSPLRNGNSTLHVDLYVPSLSEYKVTSIQRSIDSFFLEPVDPAPGGPAYHYGGGQTLSVYGALIPEPRSITFALLGFVTLIRPRTRPSAGSMERR